MKNQDTQRETKLKALRNRELDLKSRRRKIQITHYLGIILFVLIALGVLILFLQGSPKIEIILVSGWFLFPLLLWPPARVDLLNIEQELQNIEFDIDLLQFDVNQREIRAEKFLRINNSQLQKYYDLNVSQNVFVFKLGLYCILSGFIVILTTLYLVINVASNLDSKIITGVVGSIGSLLSGYIAAIYLKMHASATSHLGDFHSRLVQTHQLLFSNLLASRIEDDEKRGETLSQIAQNIPSNMK